MLLIHHIKRQGEKEIAEVATIMRGGIMHHHGTQIKHLLTTVDDQRYYKTFKTSKISDIFKPFQSEDGSIILILIDGAPGMGKTTLCKEIAYQWAKGELLIDTKIVFLLFLRDPAIQRIHDLKDLIHYFYNFEPSHLDLSKQCAEILTKRDNSDIAILMDGYDELNNMGEVSLIKDIIKRNVLSQSKILITSRPIASEKFHKLADVRVEVLGFTEQSKREYIQKELNDHPEKVVSLLSYLDKHSDINKVCYIPIIMTIMVCTFKEYEDLPANESELYERFVTLAILHCLQKLDNTLPTSILSLHKLPEVYKTYLNQLAEFAFKTIESDKVVFSNMDVERLSPTLALASKKFQGLGLFRATEHLSIKRMDNCIWYNFLHLSIHEFLAAYYLGSLQLPKQFQILKETFFTKQYVNVWVMFVGLQKNVTHCFYHQFATYFHIYGTSDIAKDQMKSVLQALNLYEFTNMNIKNIDGIFQLLCYKNTKNYLQPKMVDDDEELINIDFLYLFGLGSDWTKLFVSLCSIDTNDQLTEMYLLDKNGFDTSYYKIVTELKQNQNLSVIVVSSKALVGYRCKYHQLANAPNIDQSLLYVVLMNCFISDKMAHILSSYFINFHSLKKLYIASCQVESDQALIAILQALKTSQLQTLDLNNNNMTGKVAEHLANVIENNSDLEELCLSNNDLKSSTIVILQALKRHFHIKNLNLSKNKMTGLVTEDLANIIKNNSDLQNLNLSDNDLKLSAVLILQALTEISQLTVLNLNSNNMTGQVAEDLTNVIKSNPGLQQLHLSDNDLKSSAVVILQALKYNSRLDILDLSRNNQGVTNCCQISYTLPEIPFEISEITEIQNLKSRKVETVISKFLYISASNHVKIGRTISNKLLVKVTNHKTS